MQEIVKGGAPQIDLASIDRDVTDLFSPDAHNNTPMDDGHGIVSVDAAIAGLLEDMNRLGFVLGTTSSCAGGSGDGAGGQRAVFEVEPGKYSWAGYIGFDVVRNARAVDRTVAFLEQIRRVRVFGIDESGHEAVARFEVLPDVSEQQLCSHLMALPGVAVSLAYSCSLKDPALSAITDAAWKELHEVVRGELLE
jgi:hypothetical protein